MNERVVNVFAIIVAVVWAASVFATIFDHGYRPPPTVHLVMMAVVGAVFGAKIFKRLERKDNEHRDGRI